MFVVRASLLAVLSSLLLVVGCVADVCTNARDCPAGTSCVSGSCVDTSDPGGEGEVETRLRGRTGERGEGEGEGGSLVSGEGEGEGDVIEAPSPMHRAITIPAHEIVGAVTNFPVLVRIDADPALRTVAHGGHARDDDGRDIAFFDANGAALAHEIERYDASTGALLAWVRTSLAPGADTTIAMRWGGGDDGASETASAWSAYRAVWHLDDDATTTAIDSCGGVAGVATDILASDGMIGGGADTGADDSEIVVDDAALDFTGSISIEAWVRIDTDDVDQVIVHRRGDDEHDALDLYYEPPTDNESASLVFMENPNDDLGAWWTWLPSFPLGTWHHVAAVFNAAAPGIALYFDGQLVFTHKTGASSLGAGSATILGNAGSDPGVSAGAQNLVGAIDEVRIAAQPLSGVWFQTAYASARDPQHFIVLGDDEMGP